MPFIPVCELLRDRNSSGSIPMPLSRTLTRTFRREYSISTSTLCAPECRNVFTSASLTIREICCETVGSSGFVWPTITICNRTPLLGARSFRNSQNLFSRLPSGKIGDRTPSSAARHSLIPLGMRSKARRSAGFASESAASHSNGISAFAQAIFAPFGAIVPWCDGSRLERIDADRYVLAEVCANELPTRHSATLLQDQHNACVMNKLRRQLFSPLPVAL